MAHPCCICGGECYCHGDWDDVITSHTPKNCESCGCEDSEDDDEVKWDDYEDDDWEDWEEQNEPANPSIKTDNDEQKDSTMPITPKG